MRTSLLVTSLALVGCAAQHASSAPTVHGAAAVSQPASTLPFIEDDYAGALAQAKAQHKPLFVEAWAPW